MIEFIEDESNEIVVVNPRFITHAKLVRNPDGDNRVLVYIDGQKSPLVCVTDLNEFMSQLRSACAEAA